MKNLVGIKFLLEDGHYLAIAVQATEAAALMDGWKLGSLKPIVGGTSEDYPPLTAISWAVRADKIKAMHTFGLAELRQQAVPGIGGRPDSSGLPYFN